MNHEPDPNFVEHLEWQLRSSARRQGRFARPIPSVPVRALRTAALVVFCLMGGASAVMAAEHLQDQERKQLLVAQLDIQIEIAGARLDHLHENFERVEQLHAAGMTGSGERDRSRDQLRGAQTQIDLLKIDLEEVQATGREPRHDLAAPLVHRRDLVSPRLNHERELVLHHLVRTTDELERANLLVQAGRLSGQALAAVDQELQSAQGELELLDQRLSIRARFVAGELVPAQVDLLERLTVGRSAVAAQRRELAGLASRIEIARRQEAAGIASGEVRELELELLQAEGELRLRGLELSLLEQHGVGH